MPKSCDTTVSTQNITKLKRSWPYSMAAYPSTMRPSMVVDTALRQVESPINCATYRGSPTSPCNKGNSWGDAQEDDPAALGQESQSDEKVMSPPQHVAKLPSWSARLYRWHCRDLACHMYVSYINSLMSHLPPLSMPHFGSEAVLSPYPPIRCP